MVGKVVLMKQSVFPAITSLIISTHQPTPRLLKSDVFVPLHFFIFNGQFPIPVYRHRPPPVLGRSS